MKKISRSFWLFIILTVFFVVLVSLVAAHVVSRKDAGILEVSFLDVGQGDATFIRSPHGVEVLIDGGKGREVLAPLGKALGYFDKDIDMVVATHPDADHIGGLVSVLERYQVSRILMTENVNDTPAYDAFTNRVQSEGAEIIYARSGMVFDLGVGAQGSTTLRILFPDRDPSGLESNTSSIIAELQYGATEVLLMGDAPKSIEEYLVSLDSKVLDADVLKLGHHGSRTSSSKIFVEAVTPEYGIVSAGKDNSYGHPHKEVLDVLGTFGVITKNTADLGSIFLESDGRELWFK